MVNSTPPRYPPLGKSSPFMRSVQADVRSLREGQGNCESGWFGLETLLEPDGASSDGDRRAVGPGGPERGGTESHPG